MHNNVAMLGRLGKYPNLVLSHNFLLSETGMHSQDQKTALMQGAGAIHRLGSQCLFKYLGREFGYAFRNKSTPTCI